MEHGAAAETAVRGVVLPPRRRALSQLRVLRRHEKGQAERTTERDGGEGEKSATACKGGHHRSNRKRPVVLGQAANDRYGAETAGVKAKTRKVRQIRKKPDVDCKR